MYNQDLIIKKGKIESTVVLLQTRKKLHNKLKFELASKRNWCKNIKTLYIKFQKHGQIFANSTNVSLK